MQGRARPGSVRSASPSGTRTPPSAARAPPAGAAPPGCGRAGRAAYPSSRRCLLRPLCLCFPPQHCTPRPPPPPHHGAPTPSLAALCGPETGSRSSAPAALPTPAPPARGLAPSTPGAVVPSPGAESGTPGQRDYDSRERTGARAGWAGGGAGTAPVLISARVCRQSPGGGGGCRRAGASGRGRAAGPRPAMRHEAPMQVGARAGAERGVRRSREPGRGRSPSARAARPALLLRAEGEDTPGVCEGSRPRQGGPLEEQRVGLESLSGAASRVVPTVPLELSWRSGAGFGLERGPAEVRRKLALCLHLCSHGAVVLYTGERGSWLQRGLAKRGLFSAVFIRGKM